MLSSLRTHVIFQRGLACHPTEIESSTHYSCIKRAPTELSVLATTFINGLWEYWGDLLEIWLAKSFLQSIDNRPAHIELGSEAR
jgi:hypothetical protein